MPLSDLPPGGGGRNTFVQINHLLCAYQHCDTGSGERVLSTNTTIQPDTHYTNCQQSLPQQDACNKFDFSNDPQI
jgi:hypothetical protein